VGQPPADHREPGTRPRDEGLRGHPGVDVDGRGIERPRRQLAVPLPNHNAGTVHRYRHDHVVAVRAAVVDAAPDGDHVPRDGGERAELLSSADPESCCSTGGFGGHLGPDDLQIRPAGLF